MRSDIIKILSDWNPWWEHGKVPENLCGVKREKSDEIIHLESMKEIKIITGVRRSGKSTLLYHVIDNLLKKGVAPKDILLINFEDAGIAHYTLDEIHERYMSELNPTYSLHIFIDEVQKKEGWERWIRKKYDLRQAAGFFVSGSSSALLKKEYSTLLTGRNLSLEIFPLDFNEYLQFSGMKIENLKTITLETQSKISFNLKKYIEFGGFPEVFFNDESNKRRLL
ncbi:MAG: AAA family ATPase, partial [Nanoarchaeota archaeon]|nr:AAA family ATPase [Nanoarchaeota archaeon]